MKRTFLNLCLSLTLACGVLTSAAADATAAPAAKLYFTTKGCDSQQFTVEGDTITQAAGASCKVPVNKFTQTGTYSKVFSAKELQKYAKQTKAAHGLSDKPFGQEVVVHYGFDYDYILEAQGNQSVNLLTGKYKNLNLDGKSNQVRVLNSDKINIGRLGRVEDLVTNAKNVEISGAVTNIYALGNLTFKPGSWASSIQVKSFVKTKHPLKVTVEKGAYVSHLQGACKVDISGMAFNVTAYHVKLHAGSYAGIVRAHEVTLDLDPATIAWRGEQTRNPLDVLPSAETANKISERSQRDIIGAQGLINNPEGTSLDSSSDGTLIIVVPAGNTYTLDLDKVKLSGFSKVEKRGEGNLVVAGTGKRVSSTPTLKFVSNDNNISYTDLNPSNPRNFTLKLSNQQASDDFDDDEGISPQARYFEDQNELGEYVSRPTIKLWEDDQPKALKSLLANCK